MQQTVKSVTVETDLTLKFLPDLHEHLIADVPSNEHWELSLAYGAEVIVPVCSGFFGCRNH
ncbi:hypothetical protein [Alishewanella longhuensis]